MLYVISGIISYNRHLFISGIISYNRHLFISDIICNKWYYILYIILLQEHPDLNWKFEVWSFLFCLLNYTLFKIFIICY
jgi:hypothetical protein